MSYTPTPQAEVLDRRPTPELEDALAETAERLFVYGQLMNMNLPPLLRIGPKTMAAIQQLLRTPTKWFSRTDKVHYLLESRTLRPYRHFWGLLANVFPGPRAGVVSDLLIQAQPKLRAIFFMTLARQPQHRSRLAAYFDRYMTSAWRDPTVTLLLGSIKSDHDGSSSLAEGLSAAADVLAVEGISDLRVESTVPSEQVVSSFFRGYNKFRAAAQWDSAVTTRRLVTAKPEGENTSDASRYFASRALLRASHLVNQPVWSAQWVQQLAQRAEDPQRGAKFAAYAALYYRNLLRPEAAVNILAPYLIDEAWDESAVNHFLNETVTNTGEAWYNGNAYRRASNLIRLIVYLRAHPRPAVMQAMPTAWLRLRNIVRSFWRQESLQPPAERVKSLPLGYLVLSWVGRLERYLQTAAW